MGHLVFFAAILLWTCWATPIWVRQLYGAMQKTTMDEHVYAAEASAANGAQDLSFDNADKFLCEVKDSDLLKDLSGSVGNYEWCVDNLRLTESGERFHYAMSDGRIAVGRISSPEKGRVGDVPSARWVVLHEVAHVTNYLRRGGMEHDTGFQEDFISLVREFLGDENADKLRRSLANDEF